MAYSITIDGSDCFQKLKQLDARTQAGLTVIGSTTAAQMEAYAKGNHKWVNRTQSAENMLKGESKWEGTTLDMSIKHGVEYGIWLEVRIAFQGKYKILEEARDSQVQTFQQMLMALKL